jgi:NAD(P)-dependent dehydrogenase (short-subunit alcohol dehydrogenase family)
VAFKGEIMSDAKVALVTGASSGIGEDTARLLHEQGFIVYAVARRLEPMHQLAELGVRVFGMDVTDDASVTAGIEKIIAATGRIDVLVNNAGYGSYGSLEDVPLDEARRQFEVNVFGLARLIQLAVPHMRAQGSGRIINISSIGGKIYEPLGGWYHATKFAVEGLSDSLRIELRPFGIDVVLIEPAGVLTEWNAISRENMAKTSAGGAYAGQAASMARVLESVDTPRRSSEPIVVARKIVKAATAPHPSTRYPVGRGAGTILGARRLLPDRAFDAVISRVFR